MGRLNKTTNCVCLIAVSMYDSTLLSGRWEWNITWYKFCLRKVSQSFFSILGDIRVIYGANGKWGILIAAMQCPAMPNIAIIS